MERTAKLYGFDNVEGFAQYLISRAREEKLSIRIELSEDSCKMEIMPLEHQIYLCPHYGKTTQNA